MYGSQLKIGNESYTQEIEIEFHSNMENKLNKENINEIQIKTKKTGNHCIILTKPETANNNTETNNTRKQHANAIHATLALGKDLNLQKLLDVIICYSF